MSNELYVTLVSSDNEYLKHPCRGWLELFEIGANGSIIKGVFRQDPDPVSNEIHYSNAPVRVGDIVFTYDHSQVKFRKR